MKKVFVTATHTGVGKTYVSCQMLKQYNAQGISTLGLKLISSGELIGGVNDDARLLRAYSSVKIPYTELNPYSFSEPIAPNIAALHEKTSISVASLSNHLTQIVSCYNPEILLLEGAGGWYTPLNDSETYADFVEANQLEVILVIGIQLGCLNHGILTEKALLAYNSNKIIGWIANCFDDKFENQHEIVNTLKQHLSVPFIGQYKKDYASG